MDRPFSYGYDSGDDSWDLDERARLRPSDGVRRRRPRCEFCGAYLTRDSGVFMPDHWYCAPCNQDAETYALSFALGQTGRFDEMEYLGRRDEWAQRRLLQR